MRIGSRLSPVSGFRGASSRDARSAAAAKRVGQALESGGWRVGFSEPVRVGRWPTRREFPVTGRRLMPESSLEAFDELSASCRALAVRLGVDFDGLGAQIL